MRVMYRGGDDRSKKVKQLLVKGSKFSGSMTKQDSSHGEIVSLSVQ